MPHQTEHVSLFDKADPIYSGISEEVNLQE